MASNTERIHQLEDELRQRDRRIAELKADLAKERSHPPAQRTRGRLPQPDRQLDTGLRHGARRGRRLAVAAVLRRRRHVVREVPRHTTRVEQVRAQYNAVVSPRNVGRPLAASDAQYAQVRKLHKAGKSLRWIAEETSLGLNTVRTIVGKVEGTDRTSIKHLKRIDPDRAAMRAWKSKLQQRNALPSRSTHSARTATRCSRRPRGSPTAHEVQRPTARSFRSQGYIFGPSLPNRSRGRRRGPLRLVSLPSRHIATLAHRRRWPPSRTARLACVRAPIARRAHCLITRTACSAILLKRSAIVFGSNRKANPAFAWAMVRKHSSAPGPLRSNGQPPLIVPL